MTFLNRPRSRRRRSRRLGANVGRRPRKRKRRCHKFVRGSARRGNPLRSRMPPAQRAQIASIYRYPVKGLSPEPLPRVALEPGQTLPADRRYAIENGPSGFDPTEPKWMAKIYFLMLQRDEWLAALHARFDDASNVLTIRQNGAIAAQGNLETAEGRAAIERFFADDYAAAIKGPPKVLSSQGHSFSDVARKVVSIINLGSVRAIENMVGQPVHPLRFRANLYVEGWPAWHEFDLRRPNPRHRRGAAEGGEADHPLRRHQRRSGHRRARPRHPAGADARLGHAECGIYAEVIAGGVIGVGDAIAAESRKAGVGNSSKTSFRVPAARCVRVLQWTTLKSEGAGNAGCALHPRSRAQRCTRKAHTSIQVQTEQSGIPCAMALRLMPCSPRRANSSCHRRQRIDGLPDRWADMSADLAPATASGPRGFAVREMRLRQGFGGQRASEPHAFAVRETSAVRLARCEPLTSMSRPALHMRADAVASTTSHPRRCDTRDERRAAR